MVLLVSYEVGWFCSHLEAELGRVFQKGSFPSLDVGVGFLHWPPPFSLWWPFHCMARLDFSHGVCFLRETASQKKEVEVVSLYVLVSKLSGLSLHFVGQSSHSTNTDSARRGIAQWGSGSAGCGVRELMVDILETSTTV